MKAWILEERRTPSFSLFYVKVAYEATDASGIGVKKVTAIVNYYVGSELKSKEILEQLKMIGA